MNPKTVTKLLRNVRAGEESAGDSLLALVYDELRTVAGGLFAGERSGHTLQPTALVHEMWIKLAPHLDQLDNRIHFFAIASRAMKRILIDHSRRLGRQKRGGSNHRVTLSDELSAATAGGVDLFDLSDALERLGALNDRHARVVELRFLGGLSIGETATVLGVSHTTIEGDWFMARSWLRTELSA